MNYQNIGNITLVSGDTYNYRELIKAHGGRWNAPSKVWEIPSGKLAALQAAIAAAPAAKPTAKPAPKAAARPATRTTYAVRPAASGTCRARGCGRPVYAGGYCRSCGHDEI
jgi:hypothetical protein